MKNNKGQALVEFVLVLPIIIILIFGMIELGHMIHQKYLLETMTDTVIDLYKEDKQEVIETYEGTNKIEVSFRESGSVVTAIISKKISLITPGLNLVLDNPYTLQTTRSFYVDKDDSVIEEVIPTMGE